MQSQYDLFAAEPVMMDIRWLKEFGCPRAMKEAKAQQVRRQTDLTDQFQIGDVLIYPIHGIVRVTDIRDENIAGTVTRCYLLKVEVKTIFEKPAIKLPVNKVASNNVKRIISRKEAQDILAIFVQPEGPKDKRSWNRKSVEHHSKMKGGDIREAAAVYRDIVRLKQHKNLSHTEMRLLEQGENLVVTALAIALDTDRDELQKKVVDLINSIFTKTEV
jgi:CarD family transcriptional regulator